MFYRLFVNSIIILYLNMFTAFLVYFVYNILLIHICLHYYIFYIIFELTILNLVGLHSNQHVHNASQHSPRSFCDCFCNQCESTFPINLSFSHSGHVLLRFCQSSQANSNLWRRPFVKLRRNVTSKRKYCIILLRNCGTHYHDAIRMSPIVKSPKGKQERAIMSIDSLYVVFFNIRVECVQLCCIGANSS